LHFFEEEESISNSQRSVVGELLDTIRVHLVEQLDKEGVLFIQCFVLTHEILCESVILDNLLLERAIIFIATLLMDFNVTVQKDSRVSVGSLPFDQLEEISDLILNFLSTRELVDIDKKQVNSVISVGQDDEDDEWNTQQPGDDGALEEGIFHDLGEDKHDSSPEVEGLKSGPNFRDNFVVVR